MIIPGNINIIFISIVLALVFRYTLGHFIKPLIKNTKTTADDEIVNALRTPVFLMIILIGSHYYINSLNLTQSTGQAQGSVYTFILLVGSWAAVKVANVIFFEVEKRHGKHSDVVPFLNNLTRFGIVLVTLTVFLQIWGIDIGPLVASAGFAGLGVAFAAKDTIANFFGGISIFFDKPYKLGDYVIIDKEFRGEVIDIGMRSTKIRTRDNVLITIPNSVMITQAVINETGFDPKLRVRLSLNVSYDSELEKVEHTIVELLKHEEDVLDEPSPRVRFREFAESSIQLEALFLISPPADKGVITHEIIKKIHNRLREEGIVIPFPQHDVHLYKEE